MEFSSLAVLGVFRRLMDTELQPFQAIFLRKQAKMRSRRPCSTFRIEVVERRLLPSGISSPVITGPDSAPTSLNPLISWDPVSGATGYDVWLSNQSTGVNPVVNSTTGGVVTEFYGNPYVTVSDIDVSRGIEVSRTSGVAPMFIQVSASRITATGTDRPFEDLEYSWNFGDSSGRELISDPVTGALVNANHSQRGPEAAYVYRAAGQYSITLRVRGKTVGGFIEKTVTLPVTVGADAPGVRYYFDSNRGNDANDGLSVATAKKSLIGFAPNPAFHRVEMNFAAGGVYDGNVTLRSGMRLRAYGQGAMPVLRLTGENGLYVNMANPGSSLVDVVLSGIELRSVNSIRTLFVNVSGGSGAHVRDLYLDNCRLTRASTNSFVAIQLTKDISNFGLWNTTIDSGNSYTTGEYLGAQSGEGDWRFFVGVKIIGGVGPSESAGRAVGHNFYSGNENHQLIRYSSMGRGAVDRYFNLNMNNSAAAGTATRYIAVSDSEFTGMWAALDLSNTYNSRAVNGILDDIVFERNHVHNMSSAQTSRYSNLNSPVVWSYASGNSTFRNNIFRSLPNPQSVFSWGDVLAAPRIYNNDLPSSPSLPAGGSGFAVNNQLTSNSFRSQSVLGIGVYNLWMRARTAASVSSWSAQRNFRVATRVDWEPGQELQQTVHPELRWASLSGAERYDVWVERSSATGNVVFRNQFVMGTSVVLGQEVPFGKYRAWVRGIDAAGVPANWSDVLLFDISPKSELIAPLLPTFDVRPEFQWSLVPGAAEYELELRRSSDGSIVESRKGVLQTNWSSSQDLLPGDYAWWILPVSAEGVRGRWSEKGMFTIGGRTVLVGPIGRQPDGNVTIAWLPVSGAVRYELWVDRIGVQSKIIYQPALTNASFRPSFPAPSGDYRAWVRAFGDAGKVSVWSRPLDFSVAAKLDTEGFEESLTLALGEVSVLNSISSEEFSAPCFPPKPEEPGTYDDHDRVFEDVVRLVSDQKTEGSHIPDGENSSLLAEFWRGVKLVVKNVGSSSGGWESS